MGKAAASVLVAIAMSAGPASAQQWLHETIRRLPLDPLGDILPGWKRTLYADPFAPFRQT
jgi:hypothetical protein